MKKTHSPLRAAIGIDLGGTCIKGALVSLDSGEVLRTASAETEDGRPDAWQKAVFEMVDGLEKKAAAPVAGIGLAAPGLVNDEHTAIAFMPGRMAGLAGLDWSRLLGAPVRVINDAHAALAAEVKYGAAKGLQNAVMLTLGTGVGGGLWLNGDLVKGFANRAGHLGHISLNASSLEVGITGTPGSLENAIGNVTVSQRTFGRYADTEKLLQGYRAGDPVAVWAWMESVKNLAAALASLINVFSPEAIVLGGGVVRAGEFLFTPLKEFLEVFEWKPTGVATPVLKARFDEWSGAIGAAASVELTCK